MTVYVRDTTLTQPTTAPAGSGAEFRSGTVTLANARGLPSGVLTFSGGSLLVGVTATLNDGLSAANASASAAGGVSAGHGVTATFTGPLSMAAGSGLTFGGAPGADGVVVLAGSQAGAIDATSAVDIRAGVVRIAGSAAQTLFGETAFTSVQPGATLDVAVSHQVLQGFASLGTLTSSTGGAVLALTGAGTLGGTVTGKLQLQVYGDTTVTGVVSASTSVEQGGVLTIGAGGASGAVVLAKDDGAVVFDRADGLTVSAPINGLGSLSQIGSGTLTLTGWNAFAGGATVSAGVLVDSGYGAVGTGGVTVTGGGELVIGPSQTFANALALDGGRLASGHGSVVALTGPVTLTAGSALVIGDATHDGAVEFDGQTTGELGGLVVSNGTFALGAGLRSDSNALSHTTTVLAGATYDVNGVQAELDGLTGQGALTNTGAATSVMLNGGDFAGSVSGPLSVVVSGQVALRGDISLSGAGAGLQINPDATLTLGKATATAVKFYHPVAPGHIDSSPEQLALTDSQDFTGRVSGFYTHDTIDLRDVAFTSATGQLAFDLRSDTVVVTDGVHTAHIGLVGAYSPTDFAYSDDGTGHVLLTHG